jgi:trehalose-6-phosphatase
MGDEAMIAYLGDDLTDEARFMPSRDMGSAS